MAYTTSQIDAIIVKLESALASGQASVQFEGRSITYRSATEILSGISYFRTLRDESTGTTRVRQIRMQTSKGF